MGYVILGLAVVLIPLAAIAVGGFREWKAHAEKNEAKLSALTELEQTVGRLSERVETLEALVTGRLWNALNEEDPHAREAELTGARLEMRQAQELSPEERAERLARTMGSRMDRAKG